MLKLMHAHRWDETINVANWWVSEKLDGMRCLWDGGRTKGMPYKGRSCTGLWSRLGNIISAPDYFTASLPKDIYLDGELWIDRHTRQELFSIVKDHIPDEEAWSKVKYIVFDMPKSTQPYHIVYKKLRELKEDYKDSIYWDIIKQEVVRQDYVEDLKERLDKVVSDQGEGLMVRNPMSSYKGARVKSILKIKKDYFGTGVILGFTEGKGKYIGMIGALIIKSNDDKILELSGMSDNERQYGFFKEGDIIYFKYSGLSEDDIPLEARYVAKKLD